MKKDDLPRCPICDMAIARNMIQVVKLTYASSKMSSKLNDDDIFKQENPLITFLNRFKQLYKELMEEQPTNSVSNKTKLQKLEASSLPVPAALDFFADCLCLSLQSIQKNGM
jgi:hypothetical protein